MTFDMTVLSEGHDLCLSGGAEGADLQWGMCAGMAGHGVIHWAFKGYRSKAPESEVVALNEDQMLAADPFCQKAALSLHRPFPLKTSFTTNLLRRNWYQVSDAGACYAVSTLDKQGIVNGGTAWAVQMFIDKGDGAPCYLFEQNEGYWMERSGGEWKRIYSPPKPSGIYAAVGSRDLTTGKLAIRVLMDYEPPKKKY